MTLVEAIELMVLVIGIEVLLTVCTVETQSLPEAEAVTETEGLNTAVL